MNEVECPTCVVDNVCFVQLWKDLGQQRSKCMHAASVMSLVSLDASLYAKCSGVTAEQLCLPVCGLSSCCADHLDEPHEPALVLMLLPSGPACASHFP